LKNRQLFNDAWVRYIHLKGMIKHIADKFNVLKDKEIRNLRTDWCLRKISKQNKRMLKHKGRNIDARYTQMMKNCLSFIIPSIKDTIRQRLKPAILGFMEQTTKVYDLKHEFLKFYKQIIQIKTTWIGSWECKKVRKEWMIQRWKQEILTMMEF